MRYHLTFSVYQVSRCNLQAEMDLEVSLEEKEYFTVLLKFHRIT